MSAVDGAVACLECGEPVRGGRGWLCSERCAAVMRLVRYGRTHGDRAGADKPLDDALLNRYRREAGIVGRFPSAAAVGRVGIQAGRPCGFPGCAVRDARFVDWRDDDPVLSRAVRAEDLRPVCADHHRSEAKRRFIGPLGQSARTAPALWARMTAAEPLVFRDDERLWESQRDIGLLRNWPLADAQTRDDIERWRDAVRREASAPDDAGATGPVEESAEASMVDLMERALARLQLPPARSARLTRGLRAWFLRLAADEATLEAFARSVKAGDGAPPEGDAQGRAQ